VEAQTGGYAIRNAGGRAVLVCRDPGSAAQYAVLLNEAYWQGHQAGYRQGKAASDRTPEPRANPRARGTR